MPVPNVKLAVSLDSDTEPAETNGRYHTPVVSTVMLVEAVRPLSKVAEPVAVTSAAVVETCY